MASIIATRTASRASGTSVTVAVPNTLEAGDVLVVCHRSQTASETYPGNASFERATPFDPSSNFGRVMGIHYRVVTNPVTEPESYTFASGRTGRHEIVLLAVRGLDPSDPVHDAVSEYYGHYFSWPALSTESLNSEDEGFQIFIAAGEYTDGLSHVPTGPPSGFIEEARLPVDSGASGSRTGLWVGSRTVPEGWTGESTFTFITGVTAPGVQSVVFRVFTGKLPTPVVSLGETVNPSEPSASDGSQTVTWPAVSGAVGYSAYVANTLTPTQEDFVLVAASVTSPYTFVNLPAGVYSFGIQAKAE